jgi:hypothetical protein
MIPVNRKAIRNSLMIVVLLLIAASHFGPLAGITSMFALDKPGSVAVWFESFIYLLCSGLLALMAFGRPKKDRTEGWRWGLFAFFMLYLSVNTTAEINKKVVGKLGSWLWRVPDGLFDLGLFLLLAAVLIVVLWPVLSQLPPQILRKMILAGIVFALGAIVVDDLDDLLFGGASEWLTMLEELLEFSGFVILVDALIACLADQHGSISLGFKADVLTGPEYGA